MSVFKNIIYFSTALEKLREIYVYNHLVFLSSFSFCIFLYSENKFNRCHCGNYNTFRQRSIHQSPAQKSQIHNHKTQICNLIPPSISRKGIRLLPAIKFQSFRVPLSSPSAFINSLDAPRTQHFLSLEHSQ